MIDPLVNSPHQLLRKATQADHDRIDAAFSRYDLADRPSYIRFLMAHGRVLPPMEGRLERAERIPHFASRTPALAADLADLDQALPEPMVIAAFPSVAEAWGAFYVVEGSRLGGVMIARTLSAELPKAYLSAAHARGNWRAVLEAFDTAAALQDAEWMEQAIIGARRAFGDYDRAAVG